MQASPGCTREDGASSLPGVGKLPHPEKREQLYGGQPADRILFTIGRDLELGPGHQTEPLNSFIYPHVEVEGRLYEGPVSTRFSFEETRGSASEQAWGQ